MAKYINIAFCVAAFIFSKGIKWFSEILKLISSGYLQMVSFITGACVDKLDSFNRRSTSKCKIFHLNITRLCLIAVSLSVCLKMLLMISYSAKSGWCALNLGYTHFYGEYKSFVYAY